MELLRPEFRHYIRQIRQSLLTIQPALSTAKAIDEIDCIDRMLCLLEAEHSELEHNSSHRQQQMDTILALLQPLHDHPDMQTFTQQLTQLNQMPWSHPLQQLQARHTLLQNSIPLLSSLADQGCSAARAALQQLLATATQELEAVHQRRRDFFDIAVSAPDSAAAPPVQALDSATLQLYLRRIFPRETALHVAQIRNIPGGRSKDTTLITLQGTTRIPPALVMRRDIPGGLVPSKTVDEYAILRIIEQYADIPVPAPLYCEHDPAPLGGTFMLMAAVPGTSRGAYNPDIRSRLAGPDTMDRDRIGRQLARILAQLHQIPLNAFAATHLDIDADPLASVRATIDSTYQQALSFDNPSRVHIEMACHWLNRNLHLAAGDSCLIHCDVGLHNLLIDGDNITALLDWELACIASPARELAKILHVIDYLMPRPQFFAEYRAAGGPASACATDRLNFYAVMNYMVTNQRARYANHLFMQGQQRNIVMAHAGYESCYRVTALLASALQQVWQP